MCADASSSVSLLHGIVCVFALSQGLRALSGVLLLRDSEEDDELAYEDSGSTDARGAVAKKKQTGVSLAPLTQHLFLTDPGSRESLWVCCLVVADGRCCCVLVFAGGGFRHRHH